MMPKKLLEIIAEIPRIRSFLTWKERKRLTFHCEVCGESLFRRWIIMYEGLQCPYCGRILCPLCWAKDYACCRFCSDHIRREFGFSGNVKLIGTRRQDGK